MIWNKIVKAMGRDWQNAPAPTLANNQNNPSQTGNRVAAYDVQSWNRETHPEGRGRSRLVRDVIYDNGRLDVTYNDGFTAEYDNITPQEAKDFVQSDSKGRWALSNLWKKPYRKV